MEVQVTDRNSDENEDKNGHEEVEIEAERLSSLRDGQAWDRDGGGMRKK